MKTLKKISKLFIFGILLLVLSAAYRIMGKKSHEDKGLFQIKDAEADVPTGCSSDGGFSSDIGTSVSCGK